MLASLADSAAYADVSTRTIRRWISAGHLPGYRIGPRLIKVDLAELDAMLRAIPNAGTRSATNPVVGNKARSMHHDARAYRPSRREAGSPEGDGPD
jgi:excisionase family DNA binding protein